MTRTEYNQLVDSFSDRLLRYALKLTREYSWSQDLVQESLAKLWVNRQKVTLDYAHAFLYKVLHNKMIDDKRKLSRTQLSGQLPEKGISSSTIETTDILEKAFDQLPEKQRQIILLRDWQGYSYKEIGDILEYNESLVKVQIFRARKKMKSIITELNTIQSKNHGYQ